MIKIIHNPRCRKSREALKILIEKKLNPVIIEYLKQLRTEVHSLEMHNLFLWEVIQLVLLQLHLTELLKFSLAVGILLIIVWW